MHTSSKTKRPRTQVNNARVAVTRLGRRYGYFSSKWRSPNRAVHENSSVSRVRPTNVPPIKGLLKTKLGKRRGNYSRTYPTMKPTAATISYSGKAVDWLVSSVRSPTTAWIAPVVPQKKPTAADEHKLGLLWQLTLTEQLHHNEPPKWIYKTKRQGGDRDSNAAQ